MKATALIVLAGCARFDPGAAIEIVPDPDWAPGAVARLVAAGDCWNLAFGTRFVTTDSPATEQAVFVHSDDLACLPEADGQFTPGVPARIDVCPAGHNQDRSLGYVPPLFMVVVHELGHASGIRAEGSGQQSVMGLNAQAFDAERGFVSDAFSAEDGALFGDASPDFVAMPPCANVVMRPSVTSGVYCTCN